MLASKAVLKNVNAVLETASSICWDGLSVRDIFDILEDITYWVSKAVEACKGVLPKMSEGILGKEPEI